MSADPPSGNPASPREIALVHFSEMDADLNTRSVIKGLINASETSLIVGATQSGKTFFTLDLALHVAGQPAWRGRTIRNGSVVYVAAEAGRGVINRVAAWKLRHGYKPGDSIPFAATVCAIDLCHNIDGDAWRLATAIQNAQRDQSLGSLSLIVVDTVSRALAGGDENSPADMGAFVYSMDKLRDYFGCHVAAVPHFGKDNQRGARGHSLLTANLDTIISTAANGSGFYATVTKQREGKAGTVIPFRLEMVTLGYDGDDEPVTSCVVEHFASDDSAREPPKAKAKKMSASATRALDQLRYAINAEGTYPPAQKEIPRDTRCVSETLWRRYCYNGGVSNGDARAQQKAFKTAAEYLLAEHMVDKWQEWVWIM